MHLNLKLVSISMKFFKKRIKQLISRVLFGNFCSLIIIYLVLGLLLISSDFSKLGGHLKHLIQSCIRPGVAQPTPSSVAGKLLPHRCTRSSKRGGIFSVVLSTSSRYPEFLRRSVLGCTDFPHFFYNRRTCLKKSLQTLIYLFKARLSGYFILVLLYHIF